MIIPNKYDVAVYQLHRIKTTKQQALRRDTSFVVYILIFYLIANMLF